MSKIYTKSYQICDFCNKEYEIFDKKGLDSITLPGYYIASDGCRSEFMVTASICGNCMQKLRETLAKEVSIEDVDYVGTRIKWRK